MFEADRLLAAYDMARRDLLAERNAQGHWTGELASSPLSTATAISALTLMSRTIRGGEERRPEFERLIARGVAWLARLQNSDGGWGDTDKSLSNIATTMLARAALRLVGEPPEFAGAIAAAEIYITRAGGVDGLRRRYGRDKTFAAPILANMALAGLVAWRDVPSLPFELAALPRRFWAAARMPVVSYAVPALVAIGQVKHHFRKPLNPITRLARSCVIDRTLAVLAAKQPASGGYLEAIPLTSFVVMSLAGMGRGEHPVAIKGLRFLFDAAHDDGSWPIDIDLATWNTTLAINALAAGGEAVSRLDCLEWLLDCQGQFEHVYTGAAAGAGPGPTCPAECPTPMTPRAPSWP